MGEDQLVNRGLERGRGVLVRTDDLVRPCGVDGPNQVPMADAPYFVAAIVEDWCRERVA